MNATVATSTLPAPPPGHYQISGAALHAARTIFRHWTPKEKGRVEATLRNVAIMIDVQTQIFKLEQQLERLVHIAPWAKSRTHELAGNIEEIRHVINIIDNVHKQMAPGTVDRTPYLTEREGAWRNWQISEQAKRAARYLHVHFEWERKAHGQMAPTENSFAHVIDSHIDAWRANISLPLLIRESGWQTNDFSDNFLALRRALADMELLRNRLPRITPGIVPKSNVRNELTENARPIHADPSPKLAAALRPVQQAMAEARTVSDAAEVMRKARFIR